ncbi:MAG: pectate lyase [Actinomycetota bacterium]|nr:pectate lyase [Actinomycetota bacterium]
MKPSLLLRPLSGRSKRCRVAVVTLTIVAIGGGGALVATGASASSHSEGWFWGWPGGQGDHRRPTPSRTAVPGWPTASPGAPTLPGAPGVPAGTPAPTPSVTAPESTAPTGVPGDSEDGGGGSPVATGVVGWATQNGGTSGGSSSKVVKVSDASAFTAAVGSSTSQTVQVSGTISLSDMVKVAADKTILGTGANATITGGGLNISGVKNVVVRNVNFKDWGDDAINVQNAATNVWIDHNSFSKGKDGAVDIKRASDYVTVSWNHFLGHDKTCLLGHSDTNGSEDKGHLRVTYHHNWFDGTSQRHPRVRFANPVHVYNNYYSNNSGYGVASTEGAGVLVEANYFENVEDPFHLGEADSGPGTLVAKNNKLVNSGSGQASGSVAAIPYSYSADAADGVKSSVSAGAGAGHL